MAGFKELLKLDSRFAKYNILFDAKSINLNRHMLDSPMNKKLNETLEGFLLLLSVYLLHESAKHVLEWLLQRFAIQEYNVDAVMVAIFPMWDQNIFIDIFKVRITLVLI